MSAELEATFKKAVWLIRNGPAQKATSNDTKLLYYSYFKQATEGDVKGSQPWAVQLEARAKYDAWAKVKGMSTEEAMQKYIDLIAAGPPWGRCGRWHANVPTNVDTWLFHTHPKPPPKFRRPRLGKPPRPQGLQRGVGNATPAPLISLVMISPTYFLMVAGVGGVFELVIAGPGPRKARGVEGSRSP